ncbi:hypothetical protein I3842_07G102900 [Carya illinoinensis]|uniref:Tubby-like F-box protein 3 n=1 Tax=Carya illinoinensis TaxID=32201 RepID=A0A922JCZ4_CARIL|nr:hypothetical protein I3842_07G102900 [Carya illinoinensis]
MSIKSIIQDMRGEFGSMSRRGFEVKSAYRMKSRSQRVVQDSPVGAIHALKQSCWANLPPELLRDVLMRIEASEDTWPHRKNVVACAGVCRSWREIMIEIVKSPEVSCKLTFPISLKQPGPRDFLFQCYIKRNRSSQIYYLYLGLNRASTDDGKFLLAARKCRRPTYTDYIISLNSDDVSKGSSTFIGKLRSNFLGTKFTIYDAQPPHTGVKVTKCRSTRLVNLRQVSPRVPAGNYAIAHISYELNVLGSRSKSMRTESFLSGNLSGESEGRLVLRNKAPRWHEQLQCWCLNFNGRVTVASVKNFQLVASPENEAAGSEHENVILQFGKVGKDIFTMDYQYPISAFQAFAICLSSFDTKIACE